MKSRLPKLKTDWRTTTSTGDSEEKMTCKGEVLCDHWRKKEGRGGLVLGIAILDSKKMKTD